MLPSSKAHSVVGFCQYGVVRRNVPFLLRYYPKAVSGSPEVLNNLKPFPKIAFEITEEPNLYAGTFLIVPPKDPIAVLTAEVITTVFLSDIFKLITFNFD